MRVPGIRALAVTASLLAALGCGDSGSEPQGPTPGSLTLSLQAPPSDGRAILVQIDGPGIGAVEAVGPSRVAHARPTTTGARIAVFGPLTSGPLLTFHVPDTRQSASYSASVSEIAGADLELRTDLSGFLLSVTP